MVHSNPRITVRPVRAGYALVLRTALVWQNMSKIVCSKGCEVAREALSVCLLLHKQARTQGEGL